MGAGDGMTRRVGSIKTALWRMLIRSGLAREVVLSCPVVELLAPSVDGGWPSRLCVLKRMLELECNAKTLMGATGSLEKLLAITSIATDDELGLDLSRACRHAAGSGGRRIWLVSSELILLRLAASDGGAAYMALALAGVTQASLRQLVQLQGLPFEAACGSPSAPV